MSSVEPMFQYVLPVEASKPGDPNPDHGKGDKKKPDDRKKPDDKGAVRTQMIGEKPGDDLGYDPKIIPTEEIPD